MRKLPPPSKIRPNILVWLFVSLFAAFSAQAQDISVASFQALENDLTANTYGTMERDQNGEVAALIKIVTKEKGFLFDGGMTGIVKVKQDVGEVWVYVPHGIKRITIKHPDLGILRDYYFPLPIEKARTYEMKLVTAKMETVVTHSINKQFVSFHVSPANAVVELDDEMLTVDEEGYAEKGVSYGSYQWRVSCANYHTQAGKVTVSADGKAVVNVTLKPNFGWIRFLADEELHGANVYIDNERAGQLPFVTEGIKSGKHQVKVVKRLYKSFEQEVEISDNDTLSLKVEMQANFARVQLNAPDEDCEIWIDGQQMSQGSWQGGLEKGEYIVEVRKASHRAAQSILNISDHEARKVDLPKPTPIYSFVAISSSPSEAKVFIDGKEMGETPLMLSEVLIGEREMKFVKEGYIDHVEKAVLKENEENKVAVKLEKVPEAIVVTIHSEPKGAGLSVDGKYIGHTPMKHELPVGEHQFELSKAGYKTLIKTETLSLDGSRDISFVLEKLPWSQRVYNKAYRRMAFYASAQAAYEYPQNQLAYGASLGVNMRGINVEASFMMSSLQQAQARVGYAIALGKKLILTPQVGADMYLNVPCSEFSYSYDAEGNFTEDRRDYEASKTGLAGALCIQYCLSKSMALFITPAYSYFNPADTKDVNKDMLGGISLKAGLVFNFGRE